MSDVLGIEVVGFGDSAGGLRELADSGRVGDDDGQSSLARCTDEIQFETAGRFNDNPGGVVGFQLFDEWSDGGDAVLTLETFAGWPDKDIEVGLADIDTDGDIGLHLRFHRIRFL